ncbi:MAG: hypothetical protein ABW217_12110 [Polyangiaceae bacterium]
MSSASFRRLSRVVLVALCGVAGAACGPDRTQILHRPVLHEADDAGGEAEPRDGSVASADAGRDAGAPTQIAWQRISEGLDGLTWLGNSDTRGISGVAHGNGIWVVLGDTQGEDSALRWATSTDGVHWTPASQALPAGYASVFRLFFAQGQFVLFDSRNLGGDDRETFIYTSRDAVSWSARRMPSGVRRGFGMASDGQRTVGAFGGGDVWDSTDLARWSRRALADQGETAGTIDVAFGGGRWVASMGVASTLDGRYQEDARLFTSADGQSWQRAVSGAELRFEIEFGNDVWLAVNGADDYRTSVDGITFEATEPTGVWRAQQRPWLRFAGDRFVTAYVDVEQVPPPAVELLSSADGVDWRDFGAFPGMPLPEDALNIEYSIYDIAYADCRYVLAGTYTIQIPGALDPPLFAREVGPLLLTAEACPPAR